MRPFITGCLAAAAFVASLFALANDALLSAALYFAAAFGFAWQVLKGDQIADPGQGGDLLRFIREPAKAALDEVFGRSATAGEAEANAEGAEGSEPFDADAAFARYMEKKAAGEVEPLTGQHAGLAPPAAAPRPLFGRKSN